MKRKDIEKRDNKGPLTAVLLKGDRVLANCMWL